MRTIGTVARGVRAPILRAGDDLCQVAMRAVLDASRDSMSPLRDRDVVCVTESVLARTQGNYVTLSEIAEDVRRKIPKGPDGLRTAGILFPILSRNRFSMLLRGIAMGVDKLYIQLAYPGDEVGNQLISLDELDQKGVDPWRDTLTEAEYRRLFGDQVKHPFTGIDYVALYRDLAPNATIFLSNDPTQMLAHTRHAIACDIHSRHRTQRRLLAAGAETVLSLCDLMAQPIGDSGYNPDFGLLGSNLATEDSVKLFPRGAQAFAEKLAAALEDETGKKIEVMVYGDGAFKDPVGGIWELADPVVSPGFTKGLSGTPSELKLKYLADNALADEATGDAEAAARRMIREKQANLVGNMASQGTTPRRLTDLLGSLADLTSGSGDKGTPIVWVQGYFDTFAEE